MCKKYIIIILFIFQPAFIFAQDIHTADHVYSNRIKTVKLYRTGWNLSYPVITRGGEETLELRFDLLGNDIETFCYSFIHCDRNWNPSDIFPQEYISGFEENQAEEYLLSFNTTVNYINYRIEFPNENIDFRKSGNYIIKVYPFGEPENPVLVKRFMVSEDRLSVDARVLRPTSASDYSSGQQIDFVVGHKGIKLTDPIRTVTATILQNGRWDNARVNISPRFTGNSELIFNDISGETVFSGGSEFRYFDIKSTRYQSEYIRAIEHAGSNYHVYLRPSENRGSKEYFYVKDFNGKYYTAIQEGLDHETESDYVYVYFTLPSSFPASGDVYVFGALSDWDLTDNNRMKYNNDSRQYEASILLKQGWYNYIYYVDSNNNRGDSFESDHFETENDYLILIYYREPGERYDRLSGSSTINSLTWSQQ